MRTGRVSSTSSVGALELIPGHGKGIARPGRGFSSISVKSAWSGTVVSGPSGVVTGLDGEVAGLGGVEGEPGEAVMPDVPGWGLPG